MAKKTYFDAFIRNDTRVESWFKAELLVLFDRLVAERAIDAYERELNLHDAQGKRSQIDFSVTIKGVEHYLELKALCISRSKGTPRNLSFYFRDDDVGVIKDLKKLNRINAENKWIIAFVYPKPSDKNWNDITSKLTHWKCLSKLGDYPDYVFIALFHRPAC